MSKKEDYLEVMGQQRDNVCAVAFELQKVAEASLTMGNFGLHKRLNRMANTLFEADEKIRDAVSYDLQHTREAAEASYASTIGAALAMSELHQNKSKEGN